MRLNPDHKLTYHIRHLINLLSCHGGVPANYILVQNSLGKNNNRKLLVRLEACNKTTQKSTVFSFPQYWISIRLILLMTYFVGLNESDSKIINQMNVEFMFCIWYSQCFLSSSAENPFQFGGFKYNVTYCKDFHGLTLQQRRLPSRAKSNNTDHVTLPHTNKWHPHT